MKQTLPQLTAVGIMLVLLLLCGVASSAEKEGIHFPDKIKLKNTELSLNGLGVREATIFGIRVYVAALYRQEVTHEPEKILSDTTPSRLVMRFLRGVSADNIRDGWQEGFTKNVELTDTIRAGLQELIDVTTDVEDGDSLIFNFLQEGVEVLFNNKQLRTISQPGFDRALLSVWLGPQPPNEDLKLGLVGAK